MKYVITQTSNGPIHLEGLIVGKIHRYATCRKDYCDSHPGNWFIEGYTNITQADGEDTSYYIGVRKEAEVVYLYEVNTAEEMNALIKKVGSPVIIFESDCAEGYPKIEIYDTFRE